MLTLVLAEAELEPLPVGLRVPARQAQPSGKGAKVRLLEDAVHHEVLRAFPEGERRGRPDIVHFALLLALDSLANKLGHIRVVIHTRNDERIDVDHRLRLMRHYPSFVGLMEQLFTHGEVPQHGPLLRLTRDVRLPDVVAACPGRKLLLSEHARAERPLPFISRLASEGDLTVVIGAFPKGELRSDLRGIVDDAASLAPRPLTVWSVLAPVLSAYEDVNCYRLR